jgi:PAS domain S-box-containing protein
VNSAAAQILGLDRETLLASSLPDPLSSAFAPDGTVVAPEDFPGLVALTTGMPVRRKPIGWNRKADGRTRWLEVSAEPVQGGGALVSFDDITAPCDPSRKLERLTELYSALSQVNQAIVWSPTREALLDKMCEVMVEFGKFKLAWIGWDNPKTHEVRIISQYGDTQGYLHGIQVRSDDTRMGRGGTGTAIREGRTVVKNDFLSALEMSPWHAASLRSGFAASASIPIRYGGKVCGALVVYASERDFFGKQEIGLLEEAAGDVAYSLDMHDLQARRKEAEENLKESEFFFRESQRAGAIGSYKTDFIQGKWESSEVLDAIFGIARSYDRSIQGWLDIVHPDDQVMMDQYLRNEVIAGRKAFSKEYRIIRKMDEVTRWVHGRGEVKFDEVGHALSLIGTIQDITERKQAEIALRMSEETLAKIFQVSPDAIDLVRTSDRVSLDFNPAFSTLFGYTREEFIGKPVLPVTMDPWVDLEDRARLMAMLKEHGMVLRFETPQRRKDGSIFLAEISVTTLKIDGQPCHLSFTRDITERKQAEEEKLKLQAQLQQSQKMESLGRLAGGIAHDINNVLGAILGMATANIETQPMGSFAYRAFDTISQAAIRGGKMVQSLLSFARQNPSEKHQLDLNVILLEEVRFLERTTLSMINLEMDLADNLRPILGDASALTNAFMNLCVNAVDAMPGNGTLTLRTRKVDNDWIEVEVEDTGVGMSKEILEKAVDPFFTTKEVGKGTGLGLAMVYNTVKAHHGQLDIQSEPGQGTSVRMRFPACEPLTQVPAPVAEPRSHFSTVGLRVLLVDDDELIQSSMEAILEVLGHRVTATLNGEDALGKLESGFRPDVVIMDMNMPGLGGAETLPRLRALIPKVPVLLTTGRVDQTALDLVEAHSGVTLLSKPFSMRELQQQLEILGLG